jgi:hypothetical protein
MKTIRHPDVKLGHHYLTANKEVVTIEAVVGADDPLYQLGYRFAGKVQGAVMLQKYKPTGEVFENLPYSHGEYLVRESIDETEIIDSLLHKPGQSMLDILNYIHTPVERNFFRYVLMDRLLASGRVSVVRFSAYGGGPTTSCYFATEHGRIEIIDNKPVDFAGFQIGHIHDPMGKWDEQVQAALR